jgi:hypothetical protein
MDLASLQRHLLALIKSGPGPEGSGGADPYIRGVACSPQLEVVREIVFRWRLYDVRRACVLTARLLARRGWLDGAVGAFIRERRLSPFVEELGVAFLEAMGSDDDLLVATVARFELALLKVKRGDPGEYLVDWRQDPYAVLTDLLDGTGAGQGAKPGVYRTVISGEYPDLFIVQRVSEEYAT